MSELILTMLRFVKVTNLSAHIEVFFRLGLVIRSSSANTNKSLVARLYSDHRRSGPTSD